MTTFRNTPEELQRLDWHVLQNGAIALYHQAGVLDGDIAWLRAQRYRIDELDASAWQSASAFHADLARALRFPAHAGSNLASLLDCLGDLEVPAEGGSAIIFRHYDRFARAEARLAQLVLDALESTSRYQLLFGRRLLALVQSDDPRIRFDMVGARPVNWNPREWLDESRRRSDGRAI